MIKQIILFVTACLVTHASYAQAPTITSFSPASGPVGTLVTITGTNLSSLTAFTIGGVSAITVSDVDTVLVGMVMPGAATGAVSVTISGGTASGSGSFTVTPTPYPGTQQGNKLIGTGSIGQAWQGASVSISADGNTAIVGGPDDSSDTGAVWIYTRSGTAWTQQGSKLIGTGAIGTTYQGTSVSISADGNTAIVGGPVDDNYTGAAWVYTRSGSTWTQQGTKLVGTGAINGSSGAWQGSSVALSADGNTAIVGGPYDNNAFGAIWVYTRSGTTWTQQGPKLVGTGAIGSTILQGFSVSLSADGNTAIVGGYDDNNHHEGAAWVYTRSGTTWTQQGSKLVGTGALGTGAEQGYSVSLSADGNTAIVGGPADNNWVGAVWIYTRSGTTWSQGLKLVGPGSIYGSYEVLQGVSVSLSADASTAIVGGNDDNNRIGAVWIYTRSGTTWSQGLKLVGSGGVVGATDQGCSVSLSADGSTAIIGGYGDNSQVGAAWVFSSSTTGIEDVPSVQNAIHLYPNPNTGTFTLQTSQMQGATYTISDMLGQLIQRGAITGDSQTIDIGAAPAGIYMLSISGLSGSVRFAVMR